MNERISLGEKRPEVKSRNLIPQIQRKTKSFQSMNSPVDRVLFLQKTIGNHAVAKLIKSGALQAKLRIGQPGDIYEQEADRVAEQVMRMPDVSEAKDTSIQRKCPKCLNGLRGFLGKDKKDEKLQAKEITRKTPEVTEKIETNINALKGGGQSLPESEREFFEPRFGSDFGQVRLHTDGQAGAMAGRVQARAFTVGRDIFFGQGEYQPSSSEGRGLLAHELTHVVQQNTLFPSGQHSFLHIIRGTAAKEEEIPFPPGTSVVKITRLKRAISVLQRRARALWPVDRWENPAARLTRGEAPGETELEMNGQLIRNSTDLDAAIPNPSVVARATSDGTYECRIERSIDLTCRNRRIMPWADANGAWWSWIDPTVLMGLGFGQCAGVRGRVRFKLTARPSAKALTKEIIHSEYEHVMDTFATFRKHLVPLHDRYAHHASHVTTGPDRVTCARTILADIDRNGRINDFITDYMNRQQVHDGPGGSHHTNVPMTVNRGCTLAHATAEV